MLIKYKNLSNM